MKEKLSPKQKKKIVMLWVEGNSKRAIAAKYKISANTVTKIINDNPELLEKLNKKEEKNTESIIAYMEGRKDMVCEIIGMGLDVLHDPERMKAEKSRDIATVMGILVDKFLLINREIKGDEGEGGGVIILPPIKEKESPLEEEKPKKRGGKKNE